MPAFIGIQEIVLVVVLFLFNRGSYELNRRRHEARPNRPGFVTADVG